MRAGGQEFLFWGHNVAFMRLQLWAVTMRLMKIPD
jgi:hypothetical protein